MTTSTVSDSAALNPFTGDTAANSLLNSLAVIVAVLDSRGVIVAVNEAWKRFARENGSPDPQYYLGANYLDTCWAALQRSGDPLIEAVYQGLQSMMVGHRTDFTFEYPCHSPTEHRWFILRLTTFWHKGQSYLLAAHDDVTARKLAEDTLRESQLSLNSIVLNSPDILLTLDMVTQQSAFLNRSEFCGYTRAELEAPGSIFAAVHPDHAAMVSEHFRQLRLGEVDPTVPIEYRLRHKDGHWEWIHQRHTPLNFNPDGTPHQMLFTFTLITGSKEAEQALKASEEKWRTLFAILPVGVSIIDKDRNLLDMNAALERVLQISRDGLAQGLYRRRQYVRSDNTPIAPDDFPTVQALNEHRIIQDFEMGVIKENGDRIWTNVSAAPLPFAEAQAVVVTADITPRKQAEDELQRAKQELENTNQELKLALQREKTAARTDSLTGLNNRRHFFDLANHAFAVAQRYHQPLSIILFDIDHFKLVNDRFGHLVGDHVLEQVAVALRRNLRRSDVLARYGGEEFVVLLPNTGGRQAAAVARYLRERVVAHQIATESGPVQVTLSGGVAELLPGDNGIDAIIQRTDLALYQAKAAGRNRAILYSPEKPSSAPEDNSHD